MGLDPIREVGLEKSTYSPKTMDDEDKLREKYAIAAEIALCYLYDSWHIHDYEKFLRSQNPDVSIADLAPNGIRYSLDDIKGLESKGYDKTAAIAILETLPKYTTVIDWDTTPPNQLDMIGQTMDRRFWGEEYRFIMTSREPKFKNITTLPYDKIMLHVYKKDPIDPDYTHVAKVAFYYYSASRYIMRYCNLYNASGAEIIDKTNIDEYNVDKHAKDA